MCSATSHRYWTQDPASGRWFLDPRWDGNRYLVSGFHDRTGTPSIPFTSVDLHAHASAWPDGAVWPVELQEPSSFTQKGHITNWDYDPEFVEGDFADLKDIHLGEGPVDTFQPSPAPVIPGCPLCD